MSKWADLDGAIAKRGKYPPYSSVPRLKGTPFVIRYSAALNATGLARHKDNSDVSFILLLSRPADFGGGGTAFDALPEPVHLQQGEALVFNGQLVHGSLPITAGSRYVVSGFVNLAPEYLDMKRRATIATTVYHH